MADNTHAEHSVPIDAVILARFRASLPAVLESRSRWWHLAWTSKLLARLGFLAYSLYSLYRLHWSPVVLVAFLVVAVWTAWLCDLLAIWLGSRVWQREVDADAKHAFVLQVLRNLHKPEPRIPASVLAAGGPVGWGASVVLGGIATVCIAFFWSISTVSTTEALRTEPLALAMLATLFAWQVISTLLTARSAARGTMAGLTTGGPLMRLLALWGLMFFCFVAAVNDIESMRVLIAVLYGVGMLTTLVGLAAMPSLIRETTALRIEAARADTGS